jgi:hypothetical protein
VTRAARRPEAALFALVLGAYAYFYQAGGWNQNVRFDLTRAIVEEHQLAIDRLHRNTGDKAHRDGHFYCDKAPGVSLAGAVPYAVVHTLSGARMHSQRFLAWSAWLSTVIAVGLPSALGVVALAWLLAAFGVPGPARFGLAAAWGLATLAFPYATVFYGHQLVAALLLISFALLVRIRRGLDPPTRGRLLAAGALGAWAIVVEYPAALAAIPIGVYALRGLRRADIAWIVAGAAGPALVLCAYHWAAFGAPWRLPYDFSTATNRRQGVFMGIGAPNPYALLNLTFTPYRGLFCSAPWLALAAPGAVRLARRGYRDEVGVCLAVLVLYLWLNASLIDWDGGWAMGARYLVPAIPFLVILVAGCAIPPVPRPRRRRTARAAAIAIAVVVGASAFLMLAGTAVQPEVDANIDSPFTEFILPHLARGDIATSGQSIDMLNRTRRARFAWNLGEELGLDRSLSLAPLVAWCGVMSLLLARRARGTQ